MQSEQEIKVMIDELDQMILRLEVIKYCEENDDIADDLNEIVNDLCKWEDDNFPEGTDND